MGSKNPFTVEHIAPGIIVERSFDNELVLVNVESGGNAALEIWTNTTKLLISSWPLNTPCLLMHDLSKISASTLNQDLPEHLGSLRRFHPELSRRVAVVLPMSSDKKLFQSEPPLSAVQQKMFRSRQAALDWLLNEPAGD